MKKNKNKTSIRSKKGCPSCGGHDWDSWWIGGGDAHLISGKTAIIDGGEIVVFVLFKNSKHWLPCRVVDCCRKCGVELTI